MATDTLSLDFGRDKRFYVYLYRDPRPRKKLQPIYVGKGTASRRRADHHWEKGTHNPILRGILSKIRLAGLSPVIEIVAWFDSEAAAFDLEMALVAKFGRRDLRSGTLANMTDGGDGGAGLIVSAETRAESAARLKIIRAAQELDPAFREKCLQILALGRAAAIADPEVSRKRVASILRTKALRSAEEIQSERERKSADRKAAWADPSMRAKYLAAAAAQKQKRRVDMLARWSDPAWRAKQKNLITAAMKVEWGAPEKRAARTSAIRRSRQKDRP